MPITDWPITERPREKLLQLGSQALSDAELLAIFLRTGVRGKTAVDLARELLKSFGGLKQLLEATATQFCSAPGLGLAKYTLLQAVLEMNHRYLQAQVKRGDVINNSGDTHRYLLARLYNRPHEVFACLFLDTQNKIIRYEELFHGTIDSSQVHTRVVAKRALDHHAAGVILVHNHPSGSLKPSESDIEITHLLIKALALVEIRVLDHIIVANSTTISLAELGLLHK